MKILYVSSIVNDEDFEDIINKSGKDKPSIAGQRFEKMIADGLKTNGAEIEILSYPPLSTYPKSNILFWKFKKTFYKGVTVKYIPVINLPVLKQVSIFLFTFLYFIFWAFKNYSEKKHLLLNLVYVPTAIPSIFISKVLGIKNSVLVPDVSSFRFDYVKKSNRKEIIVSKVAKLMSEFFDPRFDSYILLTKNMNQLVNKRKKPFIVIEGMVDLNDSLEYLKEINKNFSREKFIMYAGSLRKKYGISKLIDAFSKLKKSEIELWIFGAGDHEDIIKKEAQKNPKIKFYGLRPFDEVYKFEKEALLLVNPRPSNEEFTKYSFPSKTLEYLSSGTPVLTTKLPGIPEEYKRYMYFFEEETIDGMVSSLEKVLSTDENTLENFGTSARTFVVEHKNHIVQTNKMYSFMKEHQ